MNGAAGLWDQRSSVQCNFVSYLLLGLGCCEQADHQIRSNVVASITFGALTKLVTRSQTLNQSDPFDSRTKKKTSDGHAKQTVYIFAAHDGRTGVGQWKMRCDQRVFQSSRCGPGTAWEPTRVAVTTASEP